MRYHSLRAFVHGEPVLSASLVCAVISMFFAPPSAAVCLTFSYLSEASMRYHSLRAFVHGEPVLSASLVCAVISMFFAPPSAAYLGYIDTRVLILLFCLMAHSSTENRFCPPPWSARSSPCFSRRLPRLILVT